ncbi:hypothetical protein [Thermogutta sp.]|nr:hypothetical protein [Thermogutta sp.]
MAGEHAEAAEKPPGAIRYFLEEGIARNIQNSDGSELARPPISG